MSCEVNDHQWELYSVLGKEKASKYSSRPRLISFYVCKSVTRSGPLTTQSANWYTLPEVEINNAILAITMKVYLDTCSLNLPFDDQGQERIRLEIESVMIILSVYSAINGLGLEVRLWKSRLTARQM
jgi:hypothetical protein